MVSYLYRELRLSKLTYFEVFTSVRGERRGEKGSQKGQNGSKKDKILLGYQLHPPWDSNITDIVLYMFGQLSIPYIIKDTLLLFDPRKGGQKGSEDPLFVCLHV